VTNVSSRGGEDKGGLVGFDDVFELTPNVLVESVDVVEQLHNLTWHREFHHKGWGPCCLSTDNMIKQWHSIESVFRFMTTCAPPRSTTMVAGGAHNYYERVGLFRLDAFYPEPISIMDNLLEKAVVPEFLWEDFTSNRIVNDRMFYGSYSYESVWATQRFKYARNYTRIYNASDIHSETFLKRLMEHNKVPDYRKDICFYRIRTTGLLKTLDCRVKGIFYPDFLKNFSNVSFFEGLLC